MKLKQFTIGIALAVSATTACASVADDSPALEPGTAVQEFKGGDRTYATSKSGDYAKENFQAEVTVTIPSGKGGTGIAFFGLGKGQAKADDYNQPHIPPSLSFRLCPDDFCGGQVAVFINGTDTGEYSKLGSGAQRLRMTWDADEKCGWLEIHPNWKTGAAFESKILIPVSVGGIDFGNDAHLFASGAAGVAFSDFNVKAVAAADLKKLPICDSFPNDPSAKTWLPVANASALAQGDSTVAATDAFLKDLQASFRPLVCWYKGSALTASRALAGGKLELPNSKWASVVTAKRVEGEPDALDLAVSVTLKEGGAQSAGVAVAFDFTDWRSDNFVMIPCIVYNGNRNRIIGGGYAEGQPKEDYYKKDLMLTTRDIPRLALNPQEPSKLEVNTSNTGTPCLSFLNRKTGHAFILLAEQAGRGTNGDFLRKTNGEILDNVFGVEESADRTRSTFTVAAPGVRSLKPEFIGFSGSPDRGMEFNTGDTATLKLRVYNFKAKDMAGFYDKFMAVRKAVTGANHPRCLVPASQVEKYMTGLIDARLHNGAEHKFYCPENAAWISFGWIGGLMNTFPMLVLGDDKHLERVSQTFDFAIPRGQGAAGYFYGALNHDGKVFGREGYPDPKIALTRKNADVLYWMMKQFMLLNAQGRAAAIKLAWEQNIKRLADAFVTTWKKDGQWGNYVHVDTGEVVIYNSTSAAQAMGGLALASVWYNNPEYLRIAQEAADYYYQRDFLGWGATTGHSADTLQNADGDSPMAFAASLVALYEVTGKKAWIEKARNVLNLQSSWTTSFDYELPKFTELGSLDAKLAGVIWASTQNKHSAPGHCTSASEPLLKVYRATGDKRYAELLRDIVAAHGESIRPDGRTNERLTYCDADSRGSRGGHVTGWNEINGVMMAKELPGIYLQTDADRFYVFDSVEAKVLRRDKTGVTVEIRNPTKFDSKVSVFAESAKQAKKPMGYTAFLKWPKVEAKAGETKVVTVTADGNISD